MGLKLGPELAETLPRTLDVSFPAHTVTIPAEYVWHLERDGEARCGVVVPLTARGPNGPWAKLIELLRRAESSRRPDPSGLASGAPSAPLSNGVPPSPPRTTE
jgi:hypothetical protein